MKFSMMPLALTFALATAAASPAPAKPAANKAPVVKMVTTRGTIYIQLYPKQAPISSANFEKLVRKGFYNGLTFHRIDDLMGPGRGKIVQGGDPNGNGSGGPGYHIKGEFKSNGVNNTLTHDAGAVAMARSSDPDSAGSQFYICVQPVHFLNPNYAVFGKVTKGMDVANKLQIGDRMIKVTMSSGASSSAPVKRGPAKVKAKPAKPAKSSAHHTH